MRGESLSLVIRQALQRYTARHRGALSRSATVAHTPEAPVKPELPFYLRPDYRREHG